MRDIDYWIWFSSLSGLGPVKARQLLEAYREPKIIFYLTEQELRAYKQLSPKNIEEILNKEKRDRVNSVNDLMLKNDIKIATIFDSNYPEKLKHIYDPPVALYYRGKLRLSEFSIAVVGSRRTTNYGASAAKKLSYELSMRGVQIVSGLARGIDSIAHEGCLDAGGRTAAVLGCGLDYIYPPENFRLYENILNSGGLILSEYPPGTPPLQHNFPARNRIISGISSGVLIVEAAGRSGSLITAGFALEQGREVFAVPGNIDCSYSKGTNRLIREGAKIVLGVEDILEEFDYREDVKINEPSGQTPGTGINTGLKAYMGLSTEEIRVVKIIQKGIRHIDEIIERSNISVKEINNILFMLEMKGVITQQPGKIFEMYL
ncbi:DNA-processing protein DprA [Ruminiclostridium cellobioparum]|uniref:DNA protecting protein DprA n=1 Tax=Ruminiclostridium cellobioparum subsp. termitidis CT1112 TaxID=1195236 RepID=S0FRM6_RUMCE|nr:DNA-processing protein DprA [Ruminiclostridium cellobioparum]EMS71158.1 DNA protecting protein DprA [Ruminiclostridium cellobioparum subsp. termitidis CT1112]